MVSVDQLVLRRLTRLKVRPTPAHTLSYLLILVVQHPPPPKRCALANALLPWARCRLIPQNALVHRCRKRVNVSHLFPSLFALLIVLIEYPAADIAEDSDHNTISSGDLAGYEDADNLSDVSNALDVGPLDNDSISNVSSGHNSDCSTKELIASSTQASKGKLQQRRALEVSSITLCLSHVSI